jgi:hypothetical protein
MVGEVAMPVFKQLIVGLTAVALATTAFLPDRKTAQVIDSTGKAGSSLWYTVISGKK